MSASRPRPGEKWKNIDNGEIVTIIQDEVDYIRVKGRPSPGRPVREFPVQPTHFGHRYQKV